MRWSWAIPGDPHVTRVLIREASMRVRVTEGDVTEPEIRVPSFEDGDGAASHGMRAPLEAGEGRQRVCPSIADFDLQVREQMLGCFK